MFSNSINFVTPNLFIQGCNNILLQLMGLKLWNERMSENNWCLSICSHWFVLYSFLKFLSAANWHLARYPSLMSAVMDDWSLFCLRMHDCFTLITSRPTNVCSCGQIQPKSTNLLWHFWPFMARKYWKEIVLL